MATEREAIEAARVLKEWCMNNIDDCIDTTECIFGGLNGCCFYSCPVDWHICVSVIGRTTKTFSSTFRH